MFVRTLRRVVAPFLAACAAAFATAAFASPFASITFSPSAIRQGESVRLGVTVSDNQGAPMTGITLNPGNFTYPTGLTNSATPPDVFCGTGVVAAPVGGNTLSISNGSSGSFTSCSVYLYLDVAGPGTYTATIAQGAVTTDQGPTIVSWSDTLTVSQSQVVTNVNDSGTGSLRQAINNVNSTCPGPINIDFNIPGPGPHVIAPVSALPPLTCNQAHVNGYSQPGSSQNTQLGGTNAVIKIELSGTACSGCIGLELAGISQIISGLAIHGFDEGIRVDSNGEIYGNFIGLAADGFQGPGNATDGVRIMPSAFATIGTATATGDTNLISGNGVKGIFVEGQADVSGNVIGADINGGPAGNVYGIYVSGFRLDTFQNVIRYNSGPGIATASSGITLRLQDDANARNGGPGVDIGNDGPTPNDEATVPYDQDGILNTPIITRVVQNGGNTIVDGRFRTDSSSFTDIVLFANPSIRPGITEGDVRLITVTTTTDASGEALFTVTMPGTWNNISAQAMFDTCGDGCLQSSEFSASVAATALVNVAPTAMNFGTVTVGQASATQTATITTSSQTPVPVTFTITGPFAFDASNCGTAVPTTGCTVTVKFLPTVVGPLSGTLTIDASGEVHTIALSGTGAAVPVPVTSVSPTSITYAPRTVGTVSPASDVTVTNSGSATLTITGISITGDFQFSSACPGTLAPGQSCLIPVKFAPLVAGSRTGALSIASNGSAAPIQVSLSGTGVAVAIGTLYASPDQLAFDARPAGTTSDPLFVDVVNTGTAPFDLSTRITGPFAIGTVPSSRSPCPPTLLPGTACSVAVVFAPTATGNFTGTLTLLSNASNPQVDITLFGSGAPALPTRALTVTPSLDFGGVAVGTRSGSQTVTIRNNTAQTVVLGDTLVSGDFAIDQPCGSVPANAACMFTVTFSPTTRGVRIGQVTVRNLAESQAYFVQLSGVGDANPIPQLAVTPTNVGFGNALLGPPVGRVTIEVANIGEVPVQLGALTVPADFLAENGCGTSLQPGQRCQVFVSFFPRVTGQRTGTLLVDSNAQGRPHRVFLSGTGCSVPSVHRGRIPALVCTP